MIGFGWWIGAELRTPGFGWYTTIDNHLLNVARARRFADEDIPLTALEFLAVAIGSALPWVIAAGVALWSLARRRAWRDPDEIGWVALAIWVLGVLGITALSPFRLPHYGLPASFGIALLAARGWERHGGRRLLGAHLIFFAAAAVGCAVTWMGDGGVLTSVMDVTDVATMKSAAAGLPLPVPPWEEFRPVFWAAALTFALCALAIGRGARARSLVRSGGEPRRPRRSRVTMVATMPGVARSLGVVVKNRAVKDLARERGAAGRARRTSWRTRGRSRTPAPSNGTRDAGRSSSTAAAASSASAPSDPNRAISSGTPIDCERPGRAAGACGW